MSQDKLAAYNRNIVAAEVAMRNAAALGDTDAYSRALFVLEWATKGRQGLALIAQQALVGVTRENPYKPA